MIQKYKPDYTKSLVSLKINRDFIDQFPGTIRSFFQKCLVQQTGLDSAGTLFSLLNKFIVP